MLTSLLTPRASAGKSGPVTNPPPPVRIGVVGVGKIATAEHLPTIAASPAFTLAAAASHEGRAGDVSNYPSIEVMLAAGGLDAVALCQPPRARHAAARAAIEAGVHVLLEKPPGATVAEVEQLRAAAADKGVSLFASWHSRHAGGVAPARAWLRDRRVIAVRIDWREDVRGSHPRQDWIFEPGGLGVFDPGVNALSIATAILPPFHLTGARLSHPANRQAPVAVELRGETADGAPLLVDLDFLHEGDPRWDIVVETDAGMLALTRGGHELAIDGVAQPVSAGGEYPRLYARFAELIASGRSDVDTAPLRHVADAFMLAERVAVAPFDW